MQFDSDNKAKSRLSLTPVIDVVFLLLMFFMLATTFTKFAHVDVAVGGRASSAAQNQDTPLILLSIMGQGLFSINGQRVGLDEIQSSLASAAPEGKAKIAIRPSLKANAEDIIRAIEQSQATKLGPVIMVR